MRLEHGHQDVDAYLDEWLDTGALNREVLDPLGPGGSGEYLPSLRDPATNRATRAPRRAASPGTIAIVSGELLLRPALSFDFRIHLAVSAATRARAFPPGEAWTLPAFDRYDAESRPVTHADVVVKLDDPRHPAISAAFRPASRR